MTEVVNFIVVFHPISVGCLGLIFRHTKKTIPTRHLHNIKKIYNTLQYTEYVYLTQSGIGKKRCSI